MVGVSRSNLVSRTIRSSQWIKRRGNSLKFAIWFINVISPSNRRGFNVVCPLGVWENMVSSNVEQAGAKEVPSKKTGKKVQVSVCLTAKGVKQN